MCSFLDLITKYNLFLCNYKVVYTIISFRQMINAKKIVYVRFLMSKYV